MPADPPGAFDRPDRAGSLHRAARRAALSAEPTLRQAIALASEADGDRARALWRRHIELDVIATDPLHGDAAATRAELVRRGERAAADLAAADVIDIAGYQRGDR
jgi:hypothetical protein